MIAETAGMFLLGISVLECETTMRQLYLAAGVTLFTVLILNSNCNKNG